MIIEVCLKENLKNKKIIKNNISQKELLKLLSNKFNTKIISIGTINGFKFNINELFSKIVKPNEPKTITSNHIKLVCSSNQVEFKKYNLEKKIQFTIFL